MTVTAPKFTFYTHNRGANGWKVAIVLKALGLTYEPKYLDFDTAEHKGPAYIALNPNGRIPCLVDNETGFTLWESGAIITYLVEKFDPDHKISATTAEERYQQLQWLFFQTSGQGPYYGQLGWFKLFHPEKIPSAIERYEKEIERVISVLSIVLEKQEWLLGSKVTVADLAFFTWNDLAFGPILMPNHEELKQKYPAVWAWHQKMTALPYVQEALAERAVVMGAH
ncbi:hypothetical protein MNV49_007502 [Pseudohyphozyma bogoriensis]|nr:hypothetical protein MNV49_007502 [Pseudohyphozyma bogoriensis]